MSAANEIHRPRPPEEIVREVEVEIDRDHPDISTEKRTFLRAVLVQNKIEQEIAKFNGSLPKELRQFLTASEKHSERKRFELGGKIYGFGQGLLFAYAISAMMSKEFFYHKFTIGILALGVAFIAAGLWYHRRNYSNIAINVPDPVA